MANGRLGVGKTTANQYTQIYEAADSGSLKWVIANISVVNTQNTEALVKIAITNNNTGSPDLEEHIAYDVKLVGLSAIIEKTCQTMSPGEKVLVWSDTSDLAIRVAGLEQVV